MSKGKFEILPGLETIVVSLEMERTAWTKNMEPIVPLFNAVSEKGYPDSVETKDDDPLTITVTWSANISLYSYFIYRFGTGQTYDTTALKTYQALKLLS